MENQSWKTLRKNDGEHLGVRCWKCLGERMLLVVDALRTGKKAENNSQRVRELSRKHGEEPKAKKTAYDQEYNHREVECEVCRCKV